MDGLVCDRCGEGLLLEDDVRYTLSVEVKAEYDPMEITKEDLEQDFEQQMKDLIAQLEEAPAEESQRSVYFQGKFDLCVKCQREFLKDPVFRTKT